MELLIVFILFFILFSRQSKINTELTRIKELSQKSAQVISQSQKDVSEKIKQNSDINTGEKNTERTMNNTDLNSVNKHSQFIEWIKTDWLMKLGGLLLILAFSWFVSYAFINNWIGPIGRITLGIIFGLLLMIVGEIRNKVNVEQGGVFMIIGAVIVTLTIFAAREIYGFFTPSFALMAIFLIYIFISASSIIHKKLSLSILGLILGGLAPLFVIFSSLSMVGIFSYLLVLSVGTLWVVYYTNWKILAPIAFAIIFLYNLPYLFDRLAPLEKLNAIFFAFIFATLFYIINLALITLNKKIQKSDLVLAILNGLLLILWISIAVRDDLKSFTSMGTALVFSLGAFIVYSATRLKEPIYLYSAIAIIFLGAATAFELDGPALTIAFTIEAGVLALATSFITKNIREYGVSLIPMAIPAMLALESLGSISWRREGMINDDFFVLLVISSVLIALYLRYRHIKIKKHVDTLSLALTSGLASLFYSFSLIWLSLEAVFTNNDTAHMIALFIYTIIGLSIYITGTIKHNANQRNIAGFILALVVLRLLLVDAWNMELSGRIITFFTIAMLLITTAFIGKKK